MTGAAVLVAPADIVHGQVPDGAAMVSAQVIDDGQVGPQAAADAATGFRIALEGNLGRPLIRGGAGRVWDAVGGPHAAPGTALSVGYDSRRFGFSVAVDMAAVRLADPRGAGVGLLALLHWRPDWDFRTGWTPRLSMGYVRQGIATDFAGGEFPRGVTEPEFSESEIAEGGSALAIADGLRFSAGAERPLRRGPFSWFVNGSVDVLRFRQVTFHDFAQSLREPGWSGWPRLSVGLQLHM